MSSSGHPLHDKPNAWLFWWSLIWRQAVIMLVGTVVVGALLAVLKSLGVPGAWFFHIMPWLTTALAFYSGYEASRRVIDVYDIRTPGAHHREQDHRHRR